MISNVMKVSRQTALDAWYSGGKVTWADRQTYRKSTQTCWLHYFVRPLDAWYMYFKIESEIYVEHFV